MKDGARVQSAAGMWGGVMHHRRQLVGQLAYKRIKAQRRAVEVASYMPKSSCSFLEFAWDCRKRKQSDVVLAVVNLLGVLACRGS